MDELEAVKSHLEAHDIPVRGPVDHEGWCKSIYFRDPNGIQLEYCTTTGIGEGELDDLDSETWQRLARS